MVRIDIVQNIVIASPVGILGAGTCFNPLLGLELRSVCMEAGATWVLRTCQAEVVHIQVANGKRSALIAYSEFLARQARPFEKKGKASVHGVRQLSRKRCVGVTQLRRTPFN